MSELKQDLKPESKKKMAAAEPETAEPVHTVREGAVAASIWQRQSLSGYAYYDFSLSRSWKSMSSSKTGYSRNFFSRNREDVLRVVAKACDWIEKHERQAEGLEGGIAGEGSNGTHA